MSATLTAEPPAASAATPAAQADVCLLLEGTYPYIAGGVSTWVHDLLRAQSHLTFHLVCLLADRRERPRRYEVPANVTGITHIYLHDLPRGPRWWFGGERLLESLEPALLGMLGGGGAPPVGKLIRTLAPLRGRVGRRVLMNSPAAWRLVVRMYQAMIPETSFLDFFWSWRSLLGPFYAVLLQEVPPARVYHTISTGYAGLLAARLALETGRPAIVTEHGIYTNERRIEIAMADWLYEGVGRGLAVERPRRDLKSLWVDAFISYSRITYAECESIVTLYGGNQDMQRRDGADPDKLALIPNGIDYPRYSAIPRAPSDRPTIALIGRVVPIKDVKTFIRAAGLLRDRIPDLQALIMGPTEEDPDYVAECQAMVVHLGLMDVVRFTGPVRLDDHLGGLDAIVLTSISEAQPLVILEAGAAGVPTVATDVGACREMILGHPAEEPALGPGGAITAVSNPMATAAALQELLTDQAWWQRCSNAIRERVRRHYNKADLDRIYAGLYARYRALPDRLPMGDA